MAVLQHHGHCTLKEEENRFNEKKKKCDCDCTKSVSLIPTL